ncbi:unnamed protein product [Sphagnum compactum]
MTDQFDPDFWLYANEWSPDSKHKNTQEALRLEVRQNPTFIHSYLVTRRSRGLPLTPLIHTFGIEEEETKPCVQRLNYDDDQWLQEVVDCFSDIYSIAAFVQAFQAGSLRLSKQGKEEGDNRQQGSRTVRLYLRTASASFLDLQNAISSEILERKWSAWGQALLSGPWILFQFESLQDKPFKLIYTGHVSGKGKPSAKASEDNDPQRVGKGTWEVKSADFKSSPSKFLSEHEFENDGDDVIGNKDAAKQVETGHLSSWTYAK